MFLDHQISILELFLKNHVTLKTGVIAAILNVIFNNITVLLYFCLNKCERDFFQKLFFQKNLKKKKKKYVSLVQ